jgi:hypothetical protein
MPDTRFSALGKTIDDFANKLDDSVPQADSIRTLLKSLHIFGATLHQFFAQGFADGKLEKSTSDPPEYVESLILDKVARDLDAILSAYLLRVPLSINARGGVGLGFTAKLGLTDALARAALKRAAQFNLPVNAAPLEGGEERNLAATEVLTYFDRSMQIRIIPYAPVVLISVPISGLNRNLDLSAIAHEAGHVVIRSDDFVDHLSTFGLSDTETQNWRLRPSVRSKLLSLGDTIEDDSRWYYPWLEEMFADVYGCLVAGPYVARRFLELSTAWRGVDFAADSPSHPTPAVRPFVFSETLRAIPEFFGTGAVGLDEAADRLEAEWKDHLALRKTTAVQLPQKAQPLPLADATLAIGKAVREILAAMIDSGGVKEPLDELPPWPTLAQWQSAFDADNEGADFAAVPSPAVPSPAISSPVQSARAVLSAEQARGVIDELLGEAGRQTEPIAPRDWNRVLTFGGWLDKGPEGGKAH